MYSFQLVMRPLVRTHSLKPEGGHGDVCGKKHNEVIIMTILPSNIERDKNVSSVVPKGESGKGAFFFLIEGIALEKLEFSEIEIGHLLQ